MASWACFHTSRTPATLQANLQLDREDLVDCGVRAVEPVPLDRGLQVVSANLVVRSDRWRRHVRIASTVDRLESAVHLDATVPHWTRHQVTGLQVADARVGARRKAGERHGL